jgi:hypothetical protein
MDNCINIYNDLLESIPNVTKEQIDEIKNNNDKVKNHLDLFYKSLKNEDLFLLFCMAKIKVFSSKTSETFELSNSLFGENLSLKYIFNNQSEILKHKLWDLLFNLYIQLEKHNENNQTRIDHIKESLKKLRTSTTANIKTDLLKNMLNTDVNNSTSSMLEDIIGSFQDVVSSKGNPFESIMGITEKITSKYGSMIENGDIEIDKLLGGMGGMLGKGMGLTKEEEAPVVIDENFSTSVVEVGKEDDESKKGFLGGLDMSKLSKLMPLADMVNKIGTIQTEEDILSLKTNMDDFIKNELKVDMSEYKDQMSQFEKQIQNMAFGDKKNDDLNDV